MPRVQVATTPDLTVFVLMDEQTELGYAWLRPVITSKRTGEDVGPMAELMYIRLYEFDERLRPDRLRVLFCAVLRHVMSLHAQGSVLGLVMEADHDGVARSLRHIPEVVRLREHPYYHLLGGRHFVSIARKFCRRVPQDDPQQVQLA